MTTINITQFAGDYHFLSNFYVARVVLDGMPYPTVEHAYHAAKTTDKKKRVILSNPYLYPWEAKRVGKTLPLREDWEYIKLAVMMDLVHQKFVRDEDLRNKLIETYPAKLYHGTTWGDTFWGCTLNLEGENWLGRILMLVRSERIREALDD